MANERNNVDINLIVLFALAEIMVKYKKLNNTDKNSRFFNMKNRCSENYQKQNPRYTGVYMCDAWLNDRQHTFYKWLDENYYEVDNEQMDVDKDIICYGNKQYHPDLCLVVPHSVNNFYENIEVGKTNIIYSSKNKKYSVKVRDMGKPFCLNNFDTYNDALDAYCIIKQLILMTKAESLKSQIPEIVYLAMVHTDIKAINKKYYRAEKGDK